MFSSVLQDLATGIRLSLLILGWRDWLKVVMLTLKPEYFLQCDVTAGRGEFY